MKKSSEMIYEILKEQEKGGLSNKEKELIEDLERKIRDEFQRQIVEQQPKKQKECSSTNKRLAEELRINEEKGLFLDIINDVIGAEIFRCYNKDNKTVVFLEDLYTQFGIGILKEELNKIKSVKKIEGLPDYVNVMTNIEVVNLVYEGIIYLEEDFNVNENEETYMHKLREEKYANLIKEGENVEGIFDTLLKVVQFVNNFITEGKEEDKVFFEGAERNITRFINFYVNEFKYKVNKEKVKEKVEKVFEEFMKVSKKIKYRDIEENRIETERDFLIRGILKSYSY